MERKRKKSLVEETNSWRPFVEEIQGALRARDYRKETLCGILRTLDTEVSLWPGSLVRYIGGAIIGSGFLLGRRLLYGDIVRGFLESNRKKFKGCPILVIKEFNRLMQTLFSEAGAKKYLLEESLARRKLTPEEKILQRGKEAEEHLRALVESIRVGAEAPQKLPTEAMEEEHAELEFVRKKVELRSGIALDARTIGFFEDLSTEGVGIDKSLIAALEQAADSFSSFTRNARNVLPNSSLGLFNELSQEMQVISAVLYFDEEEVRRLCSTQEWKKLIEEKERSAKRPFEDLIKRAIVLKNKIEKIIEEIANSKALLEPFLRKKDTKGRVEVLLNELTRLQLEPSLVTEKTMVIEQKLVEKKTKIEKLLSIFQKEFFELLSHLQDIEMRADRLKLEIMYARWEIFSRYTPFADLGELLDRVEQSILSTLSECDEALVVGEKSFDEIRGVMLDSLYTHNVRLLRWELLSRSLRLKDIRGVVENELLSLDRQIGLMHLAGEIPEHILSDRKWLYSFFTKLLAPYKIFQDTCDPESINVIFRYFWIDFDRFKKKREKQKTSFQAVEKAPQAINALKKAAEIMEKISGARIQVDELETTPLTWLEKNDDEFCLLPLIASHPYLEKETYLLQLKKLTERKREIEKLARAVQAVKTFEPERIEALLEAFTLLRFTKEPLDPVEKRLAEIEEILDHIEEAVVCELGLLDTKSRMESGYAVDVVVAEAKRQLPDVRSRAQKLLQERTKEHNFVGKVASYLQGEKKKTTDDIFDSARDTALLFFQNRLLVAATEPDSLARPILVLFLFEKLFAFLSKELPPEKSTKISELFYFSRKFFHLLFPKPLQKEMIVFLRDFSERVQALAPETKITILPELNIIEKELETTVSWNIPILSFLPGDLRFFLE